MQIIGRIDFHVHGHAVEKAPSCLLLGRRFHNLLLCCLEDNPDGSVDLVIYDPSDPALRLLFPDLRTPCGFGLFDPSKRAHPMRR